MPGCRQSRGVCCLAAPVSQRCLQYLACKWILRAGSSAVCLWAWLCICSSWREAAFLSASEHRMARIRSAAFHKDLAKSAALLQQLVMNVGTGPWQPVAWLQAILTFSLCQDLITPIVATPPGACWNTGRPPSISLTGATSIVLLPPFPPARPRRQLCQLTQPPASFAPLPAPPQERGRT